MKPAIIRCSKCGYQSNIISDVCIKCGAPLVKICGNCETVNSVEKNYCDGCGQLLALKVPKEDIPEKKSEKESEKKEEIKETPKISIEFESLLETVSSRAESFRKKQEPNIQDSAPSVENKDKRVDRAKEEINKLEEFEKKKNELAKKDIGNNSSKNKKIQKYVFIGLAVLLAFFTIWFSIKPRIPGIKLVMTAKKYLSALKNKDYSQAYLYLSNNSKSTCSFTDFVKYNDEYYSKINGGWDFKDVKVFSIKEDGAVIKYSLKEGTDSWRDDYISFVKEHGEWVRPYIWHLFMPIDEAISRGDFSHALFLSQKLYLTDPIDPRTSGYLCNTEYLMGLYDKAQESCKRTIEGAKEFPVGFSKEELFWFTFYYADSLRFMANFNPAIEIYTQLLLFEDISLKNKCPLFMSRSDAYVRIKEYDKALEDINSATVSCPQGINRNEALKRLSYISGSALSEAVSLARNARLSPERPTLLEMRNTQLDSINLKASKSFKYRDEWIASHIGGPEYNVVLIQQKIDRKGRKVEENEIYKIYVNLWTGSIEMNSR